MGNVPLRQLPAATKSALSNAYAKTAARFGWKQPAAKVDALNGLSAAQKAQVDALVGDGYPLEAVIRHVKGEDVLPFDVLPYKVGRFSTDLPGHEVLNNRFLELRGLATGRGVGKASTRNPAIALPRDLHASTIQKLQRKHGVWFAKDLEKLTRTQIIKKNLEVLREAGGACLPHSAREMQQSQGGRL